MKRESIIGKVLMRGTLELRSPLLIGSGQQWVGNDIDTQILRDKNDVPFIPGTSVAGVLHAALPKDRADAFFGGKIVFGDYPRGLDVQSAVNIDDIELHGTSVVMRDGVSIDDTRGVAVDAKKYDYELVERDATGDFLAEITLRGYHEELFGGMDNLAKEVRNLAKDVASGFRLGAMTAKGFGKVCVKGLHVDRYDFQNEEDVVAWLSEKRGAAIDHYDVTEAEATDKTLMPGSLMVDADFALVGSLIVKDTDVPPEKQTKEYTVHAVMKESRQDYLIPGPSVKGALRHHAGRVLKTLGFQEPKKFLNGLMGLDDEALKAASKRKDEKTLRQSRFFVDEVYIAQEAVEPFAQTRNRIDRFTGGTIGGALFTTEAVWGKGGDAPIHIHFEIRDANDADVGLALLLLKDLSLGRVPLGGEKSIGRGVLEGKHAEICYMPKDSGNEIRAVVENGRLVEKEKEADLQRCVDALADMANRAEVKA